MSDQGTDVAQNGGGWIDTWETRSDGKLYRNRGWGDPESRVEAADEIRRSHRESVAAIEANQDLTAEARSRDIAALQEQARSKLDALSAADDNEAESERKKLEKQLFSPPSNAMLGTTDRVARDASYRDGLERARRTDTDGKELQQLLRDAELTSDILLSRAALAIALQRSDIEAINVYVEAHPSDEADIQRLFDLTRRKTDVKGMVDRGFVFGNL